MFFWKLMTLSEPYKNKAIFKVEVFVVLEEIRVLQSIHTPEDIPVKSVKTLKTFRNRRRKYHSMSWQSTRVLNLLLCS